MFGIVGGMSRTSEHGSGDLAEGSDAWHLRRALSGGSGADRIESVRELRQTLEWAENEAVMAMRLAGASWSDVGAACGVSKQAAQQRFGEAAGVVDRLAEAFGREARP